jgi:hypothetical protein
LSFYAEEREMFRLTGRIIAVLTILTLFIALVSCDGSGGGGGSGSSAGTGTLVLGLTDASTDYYRAIYVTIAEVQVNKAAEGEDDEAGWQTILTPNTTYDLLKLVNGVINPWDCRTCSGQI